MVEARRSRHFNLLDIAALIGATAVGLCAIRPFLADFVTAPKVLENGRWVSRWWDPIVLLNRAVILEVMLMAWSLAWVVLQLRQPRPTLRRLIRQPSFVATCSAAVVIVVCGPITAAVLALRPTPPGSAVEYWMQFETWSSLVSLQSGAAVAAGWTLLALGRHFRRDAGWLEWIGRALGFIWVAMIAANLILPLWYLS